MPDSPRVAPAGTSGSFQPAAPDMPQLTAEIDLNPCAAASVTEINVLHSHTIAQDLSASTDAMVTALTESAQSSGVPVDLVQAAAADSATMETIVPPPEILLLNSPRAEPAKATAEEPDQYAIIEGSLNTVGVVIQQEEETDEVTYDEEDDQRGPEITENEHAFFSVVDRNVFKHRIAVAVDNTIYTDQLNYHGVSAAIFFRFPEKNRGAIIIFSFRLPRSMDRNDNEAQQDSYTLQLEIPSQTINPRSLVYEHLPANAMREQLATLFQPHYGILKEQIGDNGQCNFVNISLTTATCLTTSGHLPKLRTKELDDKFRALIRRTVSCNEESPMSFTCVAEAFGTISAQQYLRFDVHMATVLREDPINAWFKLTPHKNILNVGNLTSAQERPEIPVQRARLVFEDQKAYQLPHAYCAASEQEFRDRKVADYVDVEFSARFQEMSGSKPDDQLARGYMVYINIGSTGLDKPAPGDTIWVKLPFDQPQVGPDRATFVPEPESESDTEDDIQADTINHSADTRFTAVEDAENVEEYDEYGAELAREEAYDLDEDDQNNEDLNLWRGCVMENDLTPPGHFCLVVERRLEPKKLWIGYERPYVNTQLPAFTDIYRTMEEYKAALHEAPQVTVKLRPDHSRQVFKDEIRSLDNFQRAPHCESKRAYFLGKTAAADDNSDVTNLHDRMGPVNAHQNFTDSQRAFRESLKEVREGTIILTGAFGTGKTEVALCTAIELQSNEEIRNNLLYTSASNKAVDDAALRYQKLCDKFGLEKDIIRLYNIKTEKACTLKNFRDRKFNNRFIAQLTDDFLLEFQAAAYIKKLQDEYMRRKQSGDPRRVLTEMALMNKMLEKIADNPSDLELQNHLLQLQEFGKNGLLKEEMDSLKEHLRCLMAEVLQNADAVFCTLNMSSRVNLFTNFRADFVIIDESCRATEISTLAPFAFYEAAAYLFVGDPNQLRPVLFSAEQEKYGEKVTQNSWYRQGLLPMHKRLDEIGHPVCYLLEQHRCQGNISIYPSKRFYRGMIKNANPVIPLPARAMARHAQQNIGVRPPTNVVFVAIHHSKADKEQAQSRSVTQTTSRSV